MPPPQQRVKSCIRPSTQSRHRGRSMHRRHSTSSLAQHAQHKQSCTACTAQAVLPAEAACTTHMGCHKRHVCLRWNVCDGMMLWAILWCKVGVNGPNAKQQIRLCCHAVLSCCAVMLCCHAVHKADVVLEGACFSA